MYSSRYLFFFVAIFILASNDARSQATLQPGIEKPAIAGEAYWVEVTVGEDTPVEGLYGVSAMLNAQGAETRYESGSGEPGDFLGTDVLDFFQKVDEQTLDFAVSMTDGQGADGSGVVARTRFVSEEPGQASFALSDVQANDADGDAITLEAGDLDIEVTEAEPDPDPDPDPDPGSIAPTAEGPFEAGQAYWVEVTVGEDAPVEGLYGISAKLSGQGAETRYESGSGEPGDFLGTDVLDFFQKVDEQTMDFAVSMTEGKGSDGSGVVARAKFVSEEPGQVSFTLSDVQANDSGGDAIALEAGELDIEVVEADPEPPETPELSSPADGADDQPTALTLEWSGADHGETYHVQVAGDADFVDMIAEAQGVQATEYELEGLAYDSEHYWRVRAENESGTGDWSPVWSFMTGTEPDPDPDPGSIAPTAEGPFEAGQAYWVEVTVGEDAPVEGLYGVSAKLSGQGSQTSYESGSGEPGDFLGTDILDFFQKVDEQTLDFAVSMTEGQGADGAGVVARAKFVSQEQGSVSFTLSDVQANDSVGDAISLEAGELDIEVTEAEPDPDPPQAPELISPADGSDEVPVQTVFRWEPSEKADRYDFELAVDSEFEELVIEAEDMSKTDYAIEEDLDHESAYYWRVRGVNEDGSGEWSPEWSFTAEELPQFEGQPFITIWQTDNEGSSEDNQITIPGVGDYYEIQWEQTENPEISGSETGEGEHTITFPEPGTYEVSISGDFERIHFGMYGIRGGGDENKILDVTQWGDIEWTDMTGAFRNASHLQVSASNAPDLSEVTSLADMFWRAESMNGQIGHWQTETIEDMSGLFGRATSFNQDIGEWNTENVTDMSRMFFDDDAGYHPFNQDISGWNTKNVINMRGMFLAARDFNQDISGWDTGNVENMSEMFWNADEFNQNIGRWDTGNVTNMAAMFLRSGFNRDIGDWDTGNVTDMARMFFQAPNFNQDIGGWNTENVSRMGGMFDRANSFNQDLSSWDVSNVVSGSDRLDSMENMLDRTDLSIENYDKLLIAWSELDLQPDVTLDADGILYCNAGDYRQHMIDTYGWTINDDGLADGCPAAPSIADYEVGWNLVSLPFDIDPVPISQWFDHYVSNSVYSFTDSLYQETKDVVAGAAYWVYFTEPESLLEKETLVSSLEVPVEEGWNLIGSIDEPLQSNALYSEELVIEGTLYDDRYEQADEIRSGHGYWVRTNGSGTITLSSEVQKRPLAKTDGQDSKYQKAFDPEQSFFRLSVALDSMDVHRDFYLAGKLPDEVDRRSFTLPPRPPSGMPDIRLADNNSLTEYAETDVNLGSVSGPVTLTIHAPEKAIFDINEWVIEARYEKEKTEAATLLNGETVTLENGQIQSITISTPEVTGTQPISDLPENFKLLQNYPNPFNPNTVISYEVPRESHVTIEVYDVQGRNIGVLVDEFMAPGKHTVTWDAGQLASGVYLYRMQADGFAKTRTMMFVK